MKTIITNISQNKAICEVLITIPEGSMPVDSDEYKSVNNLNIGSYKSIIIENKFYFPEEGTFKQYPASASINNLVIAKSKIRTYEVVSKISKPKEQITNIEDMLNEGNENDILDFIENKEIIEKNDLDKILYMLEDYEFYKNIISILRQKYIFNEDIWKYSLKYGDMDNIQELLINFGRKDILNYIGHEIDLNFIKLDKTNNAHILNHLDYYPMINSRTFKLPKAESILNIEFRKTYQNYISFLITLPKISDVEYMRLCYYLVLQKRIKEAKEIFNKINYNNIIGNNLSSLELQYDYLAAYLDFSDKSSDFKKAREICKKYKNFIINYWSNMFQEIEDQLNEYDGALNVDQIILEQENNLNENNKQKTKEQKFLSAEIKNTEINIIYKNISELIIKFYLIDIEILFTKSPFIKETKIDFDFVSPYHILKCELEENSSEKEVCKTINIPKELEKKNFYIEVVSGNKRLYDIYYSSSLNYSIFESIGEIKVMDDKLNSKPIVYIKCFCETNKGEIKFYKDGFTDLNGKFNYIELNNNMIDEVKRFSILMMSKENESCITICNPPKIIKNNNNIAI